MNSEDTLLLIVSKATSRFVILSSSFSSAIFSTGIASISISLSAAAIVDISPGIILANEENGACTLLYNWSIPVKVP